MRGYVDTRWGQVHYERAGTGGPVIGLFHETPLNHAAFRRLIPLLAEDFQVVAFDTPGYGESDPPPGITTIEEYGTTLREAISGLGIDRLAIYGYHTGASVALELAASLGDRTTALIVSGLPFYEEEVRQAKVVPPVPPFADDGSHLLSVFQWEPDSYDPMLRSWLTAGVSKHPERAYQAFHAVYSYEPAKRFEAITCPVLAISNEHDPLYGADCRFVEALPGVRQEIVPSDRLPLYHTQAATVARLIGETVREAAGTPR